MKAVSTIWFVVCVAGGSYGCMVGDPNPDAVASPDHDRYAGAPYLGELEQSLLLGEIWPRSGLSERDRILVTLAVTQGLLRTEAFRENLGRALEAGVRPEEIAELITHVTMYAGWSTGANASQAAAEVYGARGISLPRSQEPVGIVIEETGQDVSYPGAPYLSALTRSVLFDELDGVWSRPGLLPRDRSMITIAVTQAMYASDHLRRDIGRGLTNGLTPEEIGEIITHVTFYAGWPTGSNAARLAAEVFEERSLTVGR